MTSSHLYCIFNANDPTPTALAIRSLDFESVTVFVVNSSTFTEKQKVSLSRLKGWINGTGKTNDWPDGWWDEDWDWGKVKAQVSIVEINGITPDIFVQTDADKVYIDLKGGTKAMSIELMDSANQALNEPEFIFSNPGETLLLSKGTVLPREVLSLSEIVYLSSGYVMNQDYVPNKKMTEKMKLGFKFTIERKKNKQRARFEKKFLKSIKKYVPQNPQGRALMEQAFLEEFACSMLSLCEGVSESVAGVKFIDPNFKISRASAQYLLQVPYIKKRMEKTPEKLKSYNACLELVETPQADVLSSLYKHDPLQIIRQHMHVMEIDALATLSSGELLGVECKYGRYGPDDVHRIRAICGRLSPRSIPVLVNSKLHSTNLYNVAELSFTEMSEAVDMIRKLDSQAPQINLQPTTRKPPTEQHSRHKKSNPNDLRNPLHCLPLIEIAVVSITASGGTYSMFKRGMERLQISMNNMELALQELGDKMGFKITGKQGNNWIEWGPFDDSESDIKIETVDEDEGTKNAVKSHHDEPLNKKKMHETLEKLLELYKVSPRSFSEFRNEVKKAGFPVKGLRKRLVRKYSKKWNFEVISGEFLFKAGNDWIIWHEDSDL